MTVPTSPPRQTSRPPTNTSTPHIISTPQSPCPVTRNPSTTRRSSRSSNHDAANNLLLWPHANPREPLIQASSRPPNTKPQNLTNHAYGRGLPRYPKDVAEVSVYQRTGTHRTPTGRASSSEASLGLGGRESNSDKLWKFTAKVFAQRCLVCCD